MLRNFRETLKLYNKCKNAPEITISEHLVLIGRNNNFVTHVVFDFILLLAKAYI